MDVIINSECQSIPELSEPLSSQGSAELNMLQVIGYDALNPPLANVLKNKIGLQGDWVIASPIHWQATHNDAMIAAQGKELQLDEKASWHYYDLYSDYLAGENSVLYYYSKDVWLLQISDKPSLNAKPPHLLINSSLMPELAQLDSSLYWQKFFTENQMFFASIKNDSLINGVWFWGGAELEVKKSFTICTDEHFFAIAQLLSSRVTLYNPSVSLKDFQILLINNINTLSLSHQEQLKKTSVHWYWNNAAYTLNRPKWFARFWRRLTHVD